MQHSILFYSEGWGLGGIERFIMNTVECLNPAKFKFDIYCTHDWDQGYDARIRALGGNRYVSFSQNKPNLVKRLTVSARAWSQLLQNKHYDIVHINTMNGVGFIYAQIAAKHKVPCIVVHSHNSQFGNGMFAVKQISHRLCKFLYGNVATDRLACSQEAGKYLFDNHSFDVIPNGTNTNIFRYSEIERKKVRKRLDIPDEAIVFGNVARLAEAKNPLFQLQILKKIKEQGREAYLLLVGAGALKDDILCTADKYGLTNFVRLPGTSYDPQIYYSALDVLTMPSVYEGFPMVIAEAASCGLPCLLSPAVPKLQDVIITQKKLSLDNPGTWAKLIINLAASITVENRLKAWQTIEQSKYSSIATAKHLESIYLKCWQ